MNGIDFKNISLDEWRHGDYRTIAMFNRTAVKVTEHIGVNYSFHTMDGLGKARSAYFLINDGRQFIVTEFLEANPPITEILVLYDPKHMHRDLDDVLSLLKLQRSALDFIYNF